VGLNSSGWYMLAACGAMNPMGDNLTISLYIQRIGLYLTGVNILKRLGNRI